MLEKLVIKNCQNTFQSYFAVLSFEGEKDRLAKVRAKKFCNTNIPWVVKMCCRLDLKHPSKVSCALTWIFWKRSISRGTILITNVPLVSSCMDVLLEG